jgi:succinate dehydrogenase / fumarate reductase cytochrome b subunit
MFWLARYVRSSIGGKHVMAVTGLLLLAFAIIHMLGHLQMFGGRDTYNAYAHALQRLWAVKWPVRAGLVALLAFHIVVGISLVARNRAARPVGYAMYRPARASIAGRTMAWTGLALLAFLAFHILHFTAGAIDPEAFALTDPEGRRDAYAMFVRGFQEPAIYVVYLAGMALLATHLGHGAASWLQTLGLLRPERPAGRLGRAIAALLFAGYMIPPTAVLAGALRLPGA